MTKKFGRSISAIALATLVAGTVTILPSFSDKVVASAPIHGGKGDRLDIRPLGTQCSEQAWPYFEANCLRDRRSGHGPSQVAADRDRRPRRGHPLRNRVLASLPFAGVGKHAKIIAARHGRIAEPLLAGGDIGHHAAFGADDRALADGDDDPRCRPGRPASRGRRARRCRTTRIRRTMMQCRPIVQLWPICTRLSILVPSPITVSPLPPRSIAVLAPISTLSWMMTRPSCGTLTWPLALGW